MELTAEVIKQYHLDILKCATLEQKQKMFLSQVRNKKTIYVGKRSIEAKEKMCKVSIQNITVARKERSI